MYATGNYTGGRVHFYSRVGNFYNTEGSEYQANYSFSLRPVVHLKSSTQIAPTSGTISEPHQIINY